jgi:hypothetical protein
VGERYDDIAFINSSQIVFPDENLPMGGANPRKKPLLHIFVPIPAAHVMIVPTAVEFSCPANKLIVYGRLSCVFHSSDCSLYISLMPMYNAYRQSLSLDYSGFTLLLLLNSTTQLLTVLFLPGPGQIGIGKARSQ